MSLMSLMGEFGEESAWRIIAGYSGGCLQEIPHKGAIERILGVSFRMPLDGHQERVLGHFKGLQQAVGGLGGG